MEIKTLLITFIIITMVVNIYICMNSKKNNVGYKILKWAFTIGMACETAFLLVLEFNPAIEKNINDILVNIPILMNDFMGIIRVITAFSIVNITVYVLYGMDT